MTTMTNDTRYAGSWTGSSASSSGLWANVERTVSAPVTVVRREALRALRSAGFSIDTEQFSLIAASRGSHLSGALLQPHKLPMSATVRIAETSDGSTISVQLVDRWLGGLARQTGPAGTYRIAFEAVLIALDAALGRIDPAARGAFAQAQYSMPAGGQSAFLANSAADAVRNACGLGAKPARDTPKAWRGAGGAAIVGSKGVANLDLSAVHLMSTVGTQIINNPGSMPGQKVAQVGELVTLLDQRLSAPGAAHSPVRVDVSDDQIRVVEFLRQQARIREDQPLRTLERCLTCRYEKIVNPDYKRLAERNRKIKTFSSSFGGIIGKGGISPFVLVGKLVQIKQLDPDYVCPRCQGLHAEPSIVTFCPKCGDRRDESVLETCPRCEHDFRDGLAAETLWQDVAVPAAASAPGPVSPAGWYADPYGAAALRWWDGSVWTGHVHEHASS